MSGNNYPQSYPVLENMLVNTNKHESARPDSGRQRIALPGRYSVQRPREITAKGAAK